MDRWRYFDITHSDHSIMNPLSLNKLDEMIALLRLPNKAQVLDIGCGKAEPLVRIAEAYVIDGIGIDPSPGMIEAAKLRTAKRVKPPSHLEFVLTDGASYKDKPDKYDLTMCLGASWAFGGHEGTLKALRNFTKPNGLILVGEPYWRKDPAQEYLKLLEMRSDEFSTYSGNVWIGQKLGLTPLYSISSAIEDFDRYEWLQMQAAERFAVENPKDPDCEELLKQARLGLNAYLHHGRDTLSWALYLFLKP